jgi:DNA-directed RNA polymerase subunit RPC12/RpoP
MEKNEILIGRQVEKGNLQIDERYKSVSRKHARIIRKPDGFYIEDLDSAGGTFVNGKAVKIKKITASDKVSLGGVGYCELNLGKALKLLPMPDKELTEAFLKLKQVYDDYQTNKVLIQQKSQKGMMMKRTIPMAVLSVIPFVGSAVGMLVGGKWAAEGMVETPKLLNDLREQFLTEYVCPACGRDFGERPWENIRRQGKCPACNREWNVDKSY